MVEMAEMQPFERIFNVFDGSDEHKNNMPENNGKTGIANLKSNVGILHKKDNGSWQLMG